MISFASFKMRSLCDKIYYQKVFYSNICSSIYMMFSWLSFNEFDNLHARKVTERAPLRKLEIQGLQLEATF